MWRHADGSPEPPLSLRDVVFGDTGVSYPAHRHHAPESVLADQLAEAERLLADPIGQLGTPPPADGAPMVGEDFEHLRWFWLPEEVRGVVAGGS